MNHLKSSPLFLLILIAAIKFSGCAPVKNQTQGTEKKLPGSIAITPSSFRCEATVIKSDQKSVSIVIDKILQRGSSLFYDVSAGDTIMAVFQTPNKKSFPPSAKVEMLIEERVMLNADKPEFIVKQIQ